MKRDVGRPSIKIGRDDIPKCADGIGQQSVTLRLELVTGLTRASFYLAHVAGRDPCTECAHPGEAT